MLQLAMMKLHALRLWQICTVSKHTYSRAWANSIELSILWEFSIQSAATFSVLMGILRCFEHHSLIGLVNVITPSEYVYLLWFITLVSETYFSAF
jgi:hypothetical protein